MDMTQIDEQWVELPRVRRNKQAIAYISNTGKYRRDDGTEGCLNLKHKVYYGGERKRCSWIIAEQFLITVRRPDQNQIDHITHNPNEYNVNDVRNLRWCTQCENICFDESKENRSNALSGSKNHKWKGDSAKPQAKYCRALRAYRRNQTEENLASLEEARLKLNEYRRLCNAKARVRNEPESPNLPEL